MRAFYLSRLDKSRKSLHGVRKADSFPRGSPLSPPATPR
jgi:hypothetical protein